MIRIRNGDSEAVRDLYRIYKNLLFALILTILKDREESEDCLQELFVQIWEKADMYDPEKGKVYTFLVTMARNKAIDRTRSRAYKDSKKEDHTINDDDHIFESDSKTPYESLELNERSLRVRNALKKLSEKEQKVLYVAYFNGMSQSEISESFDIPLGTVKYRMRQGMIKLRELLNPGN